MDKGKGPAGSSCGELGCCRKAADHYSSGSKRAEPSMTTLDRSSPSNGSAATGFMNPTPLATRCVKPSSHFEGGPSAALKSSWIQRLIPGVVGDDEPSEWKERDAVDTPPLLLEGARKQIEEVGRWTQVQESCSSDRRVTALGEGYFREPSSSKSCGSRHPGGQRPVFSQTPEKTAPSEAPRVGIAQDLESATSCKNGVKQVNAGSRLTAKESVSTLAVRVKREDEVEQVRPVEGLWKHPSGASNSQAQAGFGSLRVSKHLVRVKRENEGEQVPPVGGLANHPYDAGIPQSQAGFGRLRAQQKPPLPPVKLDKPSTSKAALQGVPNSCSPEVRGAFVPWAGIGEEGTGHDSGGQGMPCVQARLNDVEGRPVMLATSLGSDVKVGEPGDSTISGRPTLHSAHETQQTWESREGPQDCRSLGLSNSATHGIVREVSPASALYSVAGLPAARNTYMQGMQTDGHLVGFQPFVGSHYAAAQQQGRHPSLSVARARVGTATMGPTIGSAQLGQAMESRHGVERRGDGLLEGREVFASGIAAKSSKSKDAELPGPSLPPLSLFAPFKHTKERHQNLKRLGSSGKAKVDPGVSPLKPLFPPFRYSGGGLLGYEEDNPTLLTPVFAPFEPSADHNSASRGERSGKMGSLRERPSVLMPIFAPYKTGEERNQASPCSSNTASLPWEIVAPIYLAEQDCAHQSSDEGGKVDMKVAEKGAAGSGARGVPQQGARSHNVCEMHSKMYASSSWHEKENPMADLKRHCHIHEASGFFTAEGSQQVATKSVRPPSREGCCGVGAGSHELRIGRPSPTLGATHEKASDGHPGTKDLSSTLSLGQHKSASQGTGTHGQGSVGIRDLKHEAQAAVREADFLRASGGEDSSGSSTRHVPSGYHSSGFQSPLFESASSDDHFKSVGGKNILFGERHRSPAFETRQHSLGRETCPGAGALDGGELQRRETGPNDRGQDGEGERGREERDRGSAGLAQAEGGARICREPQQPKPQQLKLGEQGSHGGASVGREVQLSNPKSSQGGELGQRYGSSNLRADASGERAAEALSKKRSRVDSMFSANPLQATDGISSPNDRGRDGDGERGRDERDRGNARAQAEEVARADAFGDRAIGAPSKKRSRVDPISSSTPFRATDGSTVRLPTQGSGSPTGEKSMKPAVAQAWLQRWMPPSNPIHPLKPLNLREVPPGTSPLASAGSCVNRWVASSGRTSHTIRVEGDGVVNSGQGVGARTESLGTQVNRTTEAERGNSTSSSVGGSFASIFRTPNSFRSYDNLPSAAALALVGAASRQSVPVPPHRSGWRVAAWPPITRVPTPSVPSQPPGTLQQPAEVQVVVEKG